MGELSMKGKTLAFVLAGACCVTGALSGCSLLPKEEEALAPPLVKPVKENFDLYEVKRGNIEKKITGVATFASDRMTYLYFKESGGRLESINVMVGDVIQAGDVVATIDSGDIEMKIRQQEIAIEKARIALEQAKESSRGDVQAMRLKLLDLESAQIQMDLLKNQLAKTRLVSDISGIVTYVEPMKQGDQVTAYKPIVTVSDPKEIKLVYQVSNLSDLVGVEINMDVDVKINNRQYRGKVVQIPATAPQSENKSIQDRNARSIVIKVDDLPDDVKIGTQADITIVTEKRDNVLIIPRSGLRSYLGRDYVQVLDGESRKEVDVEKGIVAATEVEIRRGLQEGQKVILNN
jgi:RND family efflux transporter MFP subunit